MDQSQTVRVDHRLIHGQIIVSWIPHFQIDSIVVCNDDLAGNRMMREMMGCCVTSDIEVEVISLMQLDERMRESGSKGGRSLFLFKDLEDTLAAYKRGFRFPSLNIGNLPSGAGKKRITPSVYLDRKDIDIISYFLEEGIEIDIRSVYSERPCRIEKIYALRKELG